MGEVGDGKHGLAEIEQKLFQEAGNMAVSC
jgi:hypothetical protein